MSCDRELATEWAHCSRKNASYITTFVSGRQGYVVRLLNPETASRTLIKGFVGMISELAFSHKDSNTLACVDEGGNVYIWVIHEENGQLEYPLVSLARVIHSFILAK